MTRQDLLQQLPALFTDRTRLYRLQGQGDVAKLLVESWRQHEQLDTPWRMHIDALSTDATLDIQALLGRPLTLHTRLSDGSEHPRAGLITAVQALDSDGGLARYRLVVEPWLGLLSRNSASRVWQDKSVTDIVESLLSPHPQAAWAWAECVEPHLAASANAGQRSYTVQYRQTDLAFLHQLLAREAIAYRIEPHPDAPAGQRVVFFADSANKVSCPEDPSSQSTLGGRGIRYHQASSQEEQDTIQAFGGLRRLPSARVVSLSWDYKAKRAVAAEVPTAATYAGANAPHLEHYSAHSHHGAYADADTTQAQRSAEHIQQAYEARHKSWIGRSTVRSFTAGQHFGLTQSDMALLDEIDKASASNNASAPLERHRYLLTQVSHLGINNLPKALSEHIAQRLGAPEAIDQDDSAALPALPSEVRTQAAASGYANTFEAQRAAVLWRPLATAQPPERVSPGLLTATVVGPQGRTTASGAEQLHMDRLGRVRIQFDFQRLQPGDQLSPASNWVRVLQRWAGAGMGMQFMPRIGQQVLVDFVGGDIERPLIIGSLYDGQGEAGLAPSPGGQAAQNDPSAFAQSRDHAPGAQANLSGGRSPAWHGQSAADIPADGQRNAAALSGYKSAEFDNEASGYNQLVFDDSNQQLRTQLATTQHATQLNLGHLVHQADNHRGSLRGLGFELRTDAYGALRAGQGVLLSSYGAQASEPAGDNAAGIALQGQLAQLSDNLSRAAKTHQTVALASSNGSFKPTQAALSDTQAPAKALHTAMKGMVNDQAFEPAQSDAAEKSNQTGPNKLPHSTDPVVLIAAKAGQATVAGQDIQIAAQELIHLASGRDTHIATGGAARIHTGQAIGMLAGAVGPGDKAQGKGFTLIAGKGDIDVQAQASTLQIAAKKDVSIQSQSAHIDWAAAKRIVLQTAGGASITIEGGNIIVECPGKITIEAGKKSFTAPQRQPYPLPEFADATLSPYKRKARFALGSLPTAMQNFAGEPYKLYADGGLLQSGVADDDGAVMWEHKEGTAQYKIELLTGHVFEVDAIQTFADGRAQKLANEGYRSFEHNASEKADHGAEGDDFRLRVASGKNE